MRRVKDVSQIVFRILPVLEHLERRRIDPAGMPANQCPKGIAVSPAHTGMV